MVADTSIYNMLRPRKSAFDYFVQGQEARQRHDMNNQIMESRQQSIDQAARMNPLLLDQQQNLLDKQTQAYQHQELMNPLLQSGQELINTGRQDDIGYNEQMRPKLLADQDQITAGRIAAQERAKSADDRAAQKHNIDIKTYKEKKQALQAQKVSQEQQEQIMFGAKIHDQLVGVEDPQQQKSIIEGAKNAFEAKYGKAIPDEFLTPEVLKEVKDTSLILSELNAPAPDYQQVKGSPGITFDKSTGNYSFDKKAMEEANRMSKKSALSPGDVQKINDKITPMISKTVDVYNSAIEIQKLEQTSSPTDQIAAIFNFMKSLDPTSVVRETEQGMVYSAQGPAAAFEGYINKIQGEGQLNDDVFRDMVNTASTMAQSKVENSREEVARYLDVTKDTLPKSKYDAMIDRVPKWAHERSDKKQTIDEKIITSQVDDILKELGY